MDNRIKQHRWAWLPQQMPGVARLMAEKRTALGADWVNECWRRGVVDQQPGWFYAKEGALAVGTPWADDPAIALIITGQITPTQITLILRNKDGAADGAH